MNWTRGGLLLTAILAVAGCGAGSDQGMLVEREVRGDTTVVRVSGAGTELIAEEELRIGTLDGADEYTFGSVAGMAVSADGRMYVIDSHSRDIRIFDEAGSFVRRFGGPGGGPGELQQPSGIAFLPDGRLVVRDYQNARVNVYSGEGETLTSWPIPGGFATTSPMFVDRQGNVYLDIIADRSGPGIGRVGLLRLDSSGAVVDTLFRPLADVEAPRLEATSPDGRGRSFYGVPFWPVPVTTLNDDGAFVGGIGDSYAISTWHADGTVQRIERDIPAVAVHPDEAATRVEQTTRGLRQTQPDWRWTGPRPPDSKPYFTSLRGGDDGRLWVRLSQPAVRRDPDPDARPDPRGLPPLDQWLEPTVYDIFERDGSYVGTVRMPDRFTVMYMRGDHVWGVLRDDLDVPYVARLRLQTAAPGA